MSDAVRAAQERLLELRRLRGPGDGGRRQAGEQGGKGAGESARGGEASIVNLPSPIANLPITQPSNLHSQPLTAHLRAAAARRARAAAADDRTWLEALRREKGSSGEREQGRKGDGAGGGGDAAGRAALSQSARSGPPGLVRVYPDIALAMLRTKTAAAGRVWLLLRHTDVAGRGRVAVDEATRLLTGDGGPLRVCGRRQLANLLRDGDGLYWQQDTGGDGRRWLRLGSAARVAAALGVRRLGGSPVAVPADVLTGTIGRVRAHLYAAFHSGRTQTDLLTGERRGRGPISRRVLCQLSGAAPSSQRHYERRARVGRQAAIAIGPPLGAADEQETAWQRGRALFRLRDARGRHGRPGAVYLAWQLPNEYTGPHATLPRGRQKRLNRALADLFHDGMTGNGERPIANAEANGGQWSVFSGQWPKPARSPAPFPPGSLSPLPPAPPRLFYTSAGAACAARHERERYWRCGGVWRWWPETTNDERRAWADRPCCPF